MINFPDLPQQQAEPKPELMEELTGTPRPLSESVEEFRRRMISEAVRRNKGNWAAAARELGVNRSNLHHMAARLGLRS